MRVAVDFREAASPARAGKGEYVYQLVRAWLEQGFDAELVLLIKVGQSIPLPVGGWQAKDFSANPWLWHWQAVRWLNHRPVDVYLSSLSFITAAFVRSVPVILTLFDFTVWRYPGTHLPKTVWLERWFAGMAIRRAKHLLAISEFTKQEAMDLFKVAPSQITVTPMAADAGFTPQSPSPLIRERYHLPDRFILYLGTIEPRKNLDLLIDSFNQIRNEFPDVSLVLAGGSGWRSEGIFRRADSRIIFPGYIQATDRPAIYNLAEVFIFPSLYEGFGIPPLEAMACGVPTIVSDRASLPEVVGDAALRVPADDPEAFAQAITSMLTSVEMRERYRRAGLVRVQKFSWRHTAQLTWEVVRRYG